MDYIASNGGITDELERISEETVLARSLCYYDIYMEGLRNATRNLSQNSLRSGRDPNRASPDYGSTSTCPNMTPCSMIEVERRFGGRYCLHIQIEKWVKLSSELPSCLLGTIFDSEDGAIRSFYTSLNFCRTRRRHIPEGSTCQKHDEAAGNCIRRSRKSSGDIADQDPRSRGKGRLSFLNQEQDSSQKFWIASQNSLWEHSAI
jgi:hypothetical protein